MRRFHVKEIFSSVNHNYLLHNIFIPIKQTSSLGTYYPWKYSRLQESDYNSISPSAVCTGELLDRELLMQPQLCVLSNDYRVYDLYYILCNHWFYLSFCNTVSTTKTFCDSNFCDFGTFGSVILYQTVL